MMDGSAIIAAITAMASGTGSSPSVSEAAPGGSTMFSSKEKTGGHGSAKASPIPAPASAGKTAGVSTMAVVSGLPPSGGVPRIAANPASETGVAATLPGVAGTGVGTACVGGGIGGIIGYLMLMPDFVPGWLPDVYRRP